MVVQGAKVGPSKMEVFRVHLNVFAVSGRVPRLQQTQLGLSSRLAVSDCVYRAPNLSTVGAHRVQTL